VAQRGTALPIGAFFLVLGLPRVDGGWLSGETGSGVGVRMFGDSRRKAVSRWEACLERRRPGHPLTRHVGFQLRICPLMKSLSLLESKRRGPR